MTVEPTTIDQFDTERHPAWATIGAGRVSSGPPGAHLFDSDVFHHHTVRITLRRAGRKRDLHHDWIHGGQEMFEVELSEAQWASFVSSMNSGSGVPCTLRYEEGAGRTPDFPYAPRLAETIAETHRAAEDAFADIREAFSLVEQASTAKEKREAMNTLRARINNATPNVDFAGKVLIEHAEDVIAKAKVDIEAFVVSKATQLGLSAEDLGTVTMLPGSPKAIEGGER